MYRPINWGLLEGKSKRYTCVVHKVCCMTDERETGRDWGGILGGGREGERERREKGGAPRLLRKVCPVQYRLNSLVKWHSTA